MTAPVTFDDCGFGEKAEGDNDKGANERDDEEGDEENDKDVDEDEEENGEETGKTGEIGT